MKKTLSIIILATLVGIGAYVYFTRDAGGSGSFGAAADLFNYQGKRATSTEQVVSIIGTQNGTTTTGVYFLKGAATSSYPVFIGKGVDMATIFFKPTTASSTGANASFSIYGSNDYDCDTASTTYSAVNNNVLTTDINWYDLSPHISNLAGSQTLTGTTTTIGGPVFTGVGKDIVLTNLSYDCIKVEVNASSTYLYAGIITKENY